jgi:hypothetical protein
MNTHIWCDACQKIQPLIIHEHGGHDTSGVYSKPTDLVCGACKQIIATTYSVDQESLKAMAEAGAS